MIKKEYNSNKSTKAVKTFIMIYFLPFSTLGTFIANMDVKKPKNLSVF